MPICPQCGSSNFIPIIYGKPSLGLFERAERGEVVLGGCILTPNRNLYVCKDCKTAYK